MLKKILLLGTILFFSFILHAQEKGVQFMDNTPWENVIQKAKEQNKWIFVDCYTSWCGPCKMLATDVFTRDDVGLFLNDKFVNVKYDVEKDPGLDFAKKYRNQITAFPTMLMITPDEKVMQRIVGYYPAEEILQAIQYGIEGKTLQSLEKEYNAGNREIKFIKTYLDFLGKSGEDKKWEQITREYLDYIPLDSLLNKDIWDVVGIHIKDPTSKEFQFVLHNLNKFHAKKFNRYELEWQLSLNIYYQLSDIISTGFKTENKDTLHTLLEKTNELETILRNPVNRFPEYLAYARITNCYLNQDFKQLWNLLKHLDAHGLIDNMNWKAQWIEALIDHSNSKSEIKHYADFLYQSQKAEEKKSDWVVENHYKTIAKGYAKLKNKKKAEELIQIGQTLEKRNRELLKNFGL